MEKKVKNLLQMVVIVSIAVLLGAGCKTTVSSTSGPSVDTAPEEEESDEQKTEQARAESAVAELNVGVNISADKDDETETVADYVDKRVRSRLAGSGFKLSDDVVELQVTLDVKSDLFDKLGNTYRYKGEVDAEVRRWFDGETLGRRNFSFEGEREHSRNDAMKALAEDLADDAGDWLVDTCSDAAAGVTVENVTVTRRNLLKRNDAKFAENFVSTVRDIDGVVSCNLTEQDYKDRRMVFRVVYYSDRISAGLLNRLVNIDELDMKPVQ